MQSVAPGARTPPHRHECEEIIIVLAVAGTCEIDDQAVDFGARTTIVVPPGALCTASPTRGRTRCASSRR
ncbi:MAG: cupin domain-containing protein [Byssovorax sp.]